MKRFVLGCSCGVVATLGIGLALGQFPYVTAMFDDQPHASSASGWHSGWGMGITEYLVDDGRGNQLNISCPDHTEDGYVRAYATIGGKSYSSENQDRF